MKQFIINNLNHREVVCSTEMIEGETIYSGHKLAIDRKILPFILQHWFDKAYSRFYFVDYYKWKKVYNARNLDRDMSACLFNDADTIRGLSKSYDTLLDLLGEEGSFKKINIVQK
jgi:hypothetical protein